MHQGCRNRGSQGRENSNSSFVALIPMNAPADQNWIDAALCPYPKAVHWIKVYNLILSTWLCGLYPMTLNMNGSCFYFAYKSIHYLMCDGFVAYYIKSIFQHISYSRREVLFWISSANTSKKTVLRIK